MIIDHFFSKFWYEGAWTLNETSGGNAHIEDLITIVIVYAGNEPESFISGLDADLETKYSNVPVAMF